MPKSSNDKAQDTDSRSGLDAASAGIRMAEETMEKVEQWYHILEKFPGRFDPDVTDVPHDADPTGDFVESFPMEEMGTFLEWLRQHLPGEDGGLLTACQEMISSARELRRLLLLDARNRVGCRVRPGHAYYALMRQLERIADRMRIEGLPERGEKEAADLRADEPTGLPDDFTDVVGLPADMAAILGRGDFPILSDDEYAKLGAWLSANARKVYSGLDPANVAKTQRMEEAKKHLRAINEYNTTLREQTGNGSGPALKIQNRANATGQSIVQQTIINPKGNVAGINTGDMTCEDKSGTDPKKKSWFKDHFVRLLLGVLGAVIAALIVAWLTGWLGMRGQ